MRKHSLLNCNSRACQCYVRWAGPEVCPPCPSRTETFFSPHHKQFSASLLFCSKHSSSRELIAVFIHAHSTGHAPEHCAASNTCISFTPADSPWSLTVNQTIFPHSWASLSSLGQPLLLSWRPSEAFEHLLRAQTYTVKPTALIHGREDCSREVKETSQG